MTALLVRKSWEGHKQRLCDWGGVGEGGSLQDKQCLGLMATTRSQEVVKKDLI